MPETLTDDNDLKSNIKSAIKTEGLLYARHPAPDHGWKTTRALTPEIVAFKNDAVDPAIPRLGVELYREGETDEDGYTWQEESYVIDIRDLADPEERHYIIEDIFDGFHDKAVIQDRDVLLDTLAHIMAEVVNNRELQTDE